MRKIIILLICILLAVNVTAYEYSDLKEDAFINIELDKIEFDENITGRVIITNPSDYPLTNTSIILHVVSEEEVANKKTDNILYEKTIENIFVLPKSTEKIIFELPNYKGRHRVDAYAWNGRVSLNNLSTILHNPKSKYFTSINGQEPLIKINRELTSLNNKYLIENLLVNPLENLLGKIFVENLSNKDLSNLKLLIEECKWNILDCTIKKEIPFSIKEKENKEILFEIIAPKDPLTYTINYKIINDDLLSIYKSRIIVKGEVAPIRKLIYNGLNKEKTIDVLVTNSPDEKSLVTNGELITNFYLNNNKIKETKSPFIHENYSSISGGNFEADFEFDKICIDSKINEKVLDNYCFNFSVKEIINAYNIKNPEIVDVDAKYNQNTEMLNIILKKDKINVRLMIFKNEEMVVDDTIEGVREITKNYSISNKPSTIIIDDKDAKRQKVIDFAFEEYAKPTKTINETIPQKCIGEICGKGMVCSGEKYLSSEGICCIDECIPSIKKEENDNFIPLALGIAIIILVGAVIIFVTLLKRK